MQYFLSSIEGRAFRIAQIATGNRDDALDIVQDAMIKMVQNYSMHAKDEWKALFYSILQTRILDWHRRQKVRNRFRSWFNWNSAENEDDEEDFIAQQPANQAYAPDVKLQDAQFMDDLNTALSTLPLRQQQVFLMRVWEGLDIAETATVMQCSESSVKTHYARALEKLRGQLAQHHEVN
ncbi:MAG TPA: RNA polymerase sigma factor [Methylotenera sp.]|nr:RNA polymerase sigma factor [Methylotenera sp.]HPH06075.1 RNA polymerase sigma factor [Methylotenera sp.]